MLFNEIETQGVGVEDVDSRLFGALRPELESWCSHLLLAEESELLIARRACPFAVPFSLEVDRHIVKLFVTNISRARRVAPNGSNGCEPPPTTMAPMRYCWLAIGLVAGQSTLAKVLLGLETASEGLVVFDHEAIQNQPVESRAVKTIASIQMIFQNPFDTLNPSYSVGSRILRTLERFRIGANTAERRDMMLRLLDLVKLPRAFAQRSPRQLSGGQKQRIGVARAFAGRPRVIIADEPMSALDVSVQAAISELLMSLQRESRTTMVFISHDLSVVRYLADRVAVMYLGHILEMGATEQIFAPPFHPYTEALLSAIPIADARVKKRHVVLEGEIPSALSPPSGCPFQTRCGHKRELPGNLCEREMPPTSHGRRRPHRQVPSADRSPEAHGASVRMTDWPSA